MDRKVSTDQLKVGMFVTYLDRPWTDTPLLFQGMTIKDEETIRLLHRYCHYVFIDPSRGVAANEYLDEEPELTLESREHDESEMEGRRDEILYKLLGYHPIEYHDKSNVREELPKAKESRVKVTLMIKDMMRSVQENKRVDLPELREVMAPMIESILRNPDAFMWLTKMKEKDSYTYNHSLDTCALAVIFGRHLGLPISRLNAVAAGALMMDVGKMRCPDELLRKRTRLTDEEFEQLKKHVHYSADVLHEIKDLPDGVMELVMSHHERNDGSGYPLGLSGSDIHIYGRIAAIADCYDAITSDRPYSHAMPPHQAINKIYEWRKTLFQPELVEQFIQCLGVYPIGSLVELSTQEVAIITGLNRARRLWPKVMIVLDPNKTPYKEFREIDLMKKMQESKGGHIDILRTLEPGAYGIDPAKFFL